MHVNHSSTRGTAIVVFLVKYTNDWLEHLSTTHMIGYNTPILV